MGQFTHLSFSLKPHTMTNFSLSGGLIGQNIWWHLCGCLEPLIPSERITTQGSENLISSQPLNTCVRVCVCAHWKLLWTVCRWTTRGSFCDQALQSLRFQEQETRHKDRLSSGRFWPEPWTRVLFEGEREGERERVKVEERIGSWRFWFAI